MKETAAESAELKQSLKHDPVTDELRAEAERFPLEADESVIEVENGHDTCSPGSWVAERLADPDEQLVADAAGAARAIEQLEDPEDTTHGG